MALTIDGNNLVFEGTVTISNFTNPANGVCTLVLTPSGGVGNLPALVDGTPGLPPTFSVASVSTLAPGQPATFGITQTDPGGPGTASAYTIAVGLPQGATGTNGESGAIGQAPDLTGTAAAGDIITCTAVTSGTPAFGYMQFPWGFVVNDITPTEASTSGKTTATLAEVSLAAQTYNYIPVVFAQSNITGTANTVINLQATLGSTTGQVLGSSDGIAGIPSQQRTIIPSFGGLVGISYGYVNASSTAAIYLTASQTANVADTWSTADTKFTIIGIPVSA